MIDEKVELKFHRYLMKDGYQSVGMTGPVTWTFFEADMQLLTFEEMKYLFAGWYINFYAIQSGSIDYEISDKAKDDLTKKLSIEDGSFVQIVDYLHFGALVFYSAKYRTASDHKIVSVFEEHNLELNSGSKYLDLPPLYYFIGKLFYEGLL
jgi:hypothetical protein